MKYTFNNKYLKDNSKPGSYRRGYETFQKGMIEDLKFNENIVRAKIKGNFKPHYETGIKFTKAGAKPTDTVKSLLTKEGLIVKFLEEKAKAE